MTLTGFAGSQAIALFALLISERSGDPAVIDEDARGIRRARMHREMSEITPG